MKNEKEIKEKALEHLHSLSEAELEGISEIDFEIHLPNAEGKEERYTVFLEKGFIEGKEEWTVRNIICPDALQEPEDKDDGKIE